MSHPINPNPDEIAALKRLCNGEQTLSRALQYYKLLSTLRAKAGLPKGTLQMCTWLAAEKEELQRPSMVLTKAQRESGVSRAAFVDAAASIHKLLSEAQASARSVDLGKVAKSSCPPPLVWENTCSSCRNRPMPCIRVSGSTLCLSCFVKHSPCERQSFAKDGAFHSKPSLSSTDPDIVFSGYADLIEASQSDVASAVESSFLRGRRDSSVAQGSQRPPVKSGAPPPSKTKGVRPAESRAGTALATQVPASSKAAARSKAQQTAPNRPKYPINSSTSRCSDPNISPPLGQTAERLKESTFIVPSTQPAKPSRKDSLSGGGQAVQEPSSSRAPSAKRPSHGQGEQTAKRSRHGPNTGVRPSASASMGSSAQTGSTAASGSRADVSSIRPIKAERAPSEELVLDSLPESTSITEPAQQHPPSSSQARIPSAGPSRPVGGFYAILRREIRRVAVAIISHVDEHGCDDAELHFKIIDLRTRLRLWPEYSREAMQELSAEVEESPLTTLEEMIREAEEAIIVYVKENRCPDVRLCVLVADLKERLRLRPK